MLRFCRALNAADAWFAARRGQPFEFQREVRAATAAGRNGLLHAATGSGETYAVQHRVDPILRDAERALAEEAPPQPRRIRRTA